MRDLLVPTQSVGMNTETPEGKNYTDAQIRALTEFQERFFNSAWGASSSQASQRIAVSFCIVILIVCRRHR